ncbi:MAG: GNAT family N-acetyltransferase [Actinobacteria bacterium]|nr:GNAT family N-acetyltransferase [Actinomycetota bacterium]
MSGSTTIEATVRPGAKSRQKAALALLGEVFSKDDPAYFRLHQTNDPAWDLNQTRLMEVDGQIVAHLWVADRVMRYGDGRIRFGGVADVATAPPHRRHGYCGRLLDGAIKMMQASDQPLSVLFTDKPGVYASRGWHVVPCTWVEARVPAAPVENAGGHGVRPFEEADLPAVMQTYAEVTARHAGPLDRPEELWRAMQRWLPYNHGGVQLFFDVVVQVRTVIGYALSAIRGSELLILDAGIESAGLGPALLRAWQERAHQHGVTRITGRLPHTHPMFDVLAAKADGRAVTKREIMLRLNSLHGVMAGIQPELERRRRRAAPLPGPTFALEVDGQSVRIETPIAKVVLGVPAGSDPAVRLSSSDFLHLLMGLDSGRAAVRRQKLPPPVQVYMERLFPNTGYTYWLADAF